MNKYVFILALLFPALAFAQATQQKAPPKTEAKPSNAPRKGCSGAGRPVERRYKAESSDPIFEVHE